MITELASCSNHTLPVSLPLPQTHWMTQFSANPRFFGAIPLPGMLSLFPLPHLSGRLSFLKLNIQKTKIMTLGPITWWQIDGEKVKTVSDFIFLGPQITADGDCSHETNRQFLLERETMTNLDSVLKSRAIPLPTKVPVVKAIVYKVVMFGCESWTIKKAECWRTDAFKLCCWGRFLRVSWICRRSN